MKNRTDNPQHLHEREKTSNSLVHIWTACYPDQQRGTRHLKTKP